MKYNNYKMVDKHGQETRCKINSISKFCGENCKGQARIEGGDRCVVTDGLHAENIISKPNQSRLVCIQIIAEHIQRHGRSEIHF